jgi:hypothetical protein
LRTWPASGAPGEAIDKGEKIYAARQATWSIDRRSLKNRYFIKLSGARSSYGALPLRGDKGKGNQWLNFKGCLKVKIMTLRNIIYSKKHILLQYVLLLGGVLGYVHVIVLGEEYPIQGISKTLVFYKWKF